MGNTGTNRLVLIRILRHNLIQILLCIAGIQIAVADAEEETRLDNIIHIHKVEKSADRLQQLKRLILKHHPLVKDDDIADEIDEKEENGIMLSIIVRKTLAIQQKNILLRNMIEVDPLCNMFTATHG